MKKIMKLTTCLVLLNSCVQNINANDLDLQDSSLSNPESSRIKSTKPLESSQEPVIDRVKWIDRMQYTISSDIELDAPIWKNTEEMRNAYGDIYITTLIEEAHKVAAPYLKYKDHQAYNAFMALALTFPLHEGLYMSFREINDEEGLCSEKSNSGDIMFKESKKKIFDEVNLNLEDKYLSNEQRNELEALKVTSEESYLEKRENTVNDFTRVLLDQKKDRIENSEKPSNYGHFIKYLKEDGKEFIVDCNDVRNDKVIRQMIRGGDGTDIGPMQLSLRWHFPEFLAKKQYLSLRKTMRYGLKYIHKGFKRIYYKTLKRNKEARKVYSCILTKEKKIRNRKIDFSKLIRGTWSGQYNQGQAHKACRIDAIAKYEELKAKTFIKKSVLNTELEKIKKHPDYHFMNNLNKVKDFDNAKLIGYTKSISFKLSPNVKNAVNEIADNMKVKRYNGKKHSKVLSLIK